MKATRKKVNCEDVVKDWNSGMSVKEIAKKYHVSRNCIYYNIHPDARKFRMKVIKSKLQKKVQNRPEMKVEAKPYLTIDEIKEKYNISDAELKFLEKRKIIKVRFVGRIKEYQSNHVEYYLFHRRKKIK